MQKFLYYAFGGGLGHVVRSTALARQLARLGGRHRVVNNSLFPEMIRKIGQVETVIEIEAIPYTYNAPQAGKAFRDIHQSFQPDVLIVDTFPRGLGGELVDLLESEQHDQRVLISRGLPQAYVDSKQLGPFVKSHFDLVIAPGEPFGVGPPSQKRGLSLTRQSEILGKPVCPSKGQPSFLTNKHWCSLRSAQPAIFSQAGPFLIRDRDELGDREHASRLIRTEPDRPVVLIVGSGNKNECLEAATLYSDLKKKSDAIDVQIRLALPCDVVRNSRELLQAETVIDHWPLFECLPAVDLVIGSAGYNLFWETEMIGVESLLQSRQRTYDVQSRRASKRGPIDIPEIITRIESISIRDSISGYSNGASEAACLIVNH